MFEVNFAVNQQQRDKPNCPLAMCIKIGNDHAAYGWSRTPDGHWGEEQKQAYYAGYDGYKKDS